MLWLNRRFLQATSSPNQMETLTVVLHIGTNIGLSVVQQNKYSSLRVVVLYASFLIGFPIAITMQDPRPSTESRPGSV
jgi:hypothetical protein